MRRALLPFVVLLAAPLWALEVPPAPTTYLTDYAGVIGKTEAERIDQRLAGVEQSTGHQVVVALFSSLDGESLEDFTIRCAERWKVGRKKLDDGVIFFVFVADRRMRLEVGYGLEGTIPDALAARIIDTAKPDFSRQDYAGGVGAVISAIEATFRGDPPPERKRGGGGAGAVNLIALIVALLLSAFLRPRRGRRGGRGSGIWWGGMGGFGGGGFGGGSFGGFSGGGGSFGGGGASGGW